MTPLTLGIDHIGLTVSDLELSKAFFIDCLGWMVFGGRPDYPSVYITNGEARLTLWQVADTVDFTPFDRRANVGLHHLALAVATRETLDALHAKVSAWPGVEVEFAPELSGAGPKYHCMIREPGGCRVEFAWDPRRA